MGARHMSTEVALCTVSQEILPGPCSGPVNSYFANNANEHMERGDSLTALTN